MSRLNQVLSSAKKIWFYLITFLFIAINGILLHSENYVLIIFPALLFIVYLGLFKLDILYLIVIFLVPLSINFDSLGSNLSVGVALPTEPLIVGMMLVFIVKLFFDGSFDLKITKHPVTLLIIGHLIWLGLTTITSELPLVSFKYFLSRFWFVAVFYFIASQVFQKGNYSSKLFWLYILGFIPVILYTLYEHSIRSFSQASANWVMNPFFNDHTSYGACLVMFFIGAPFGAIVRKGGLGLPVVIGVLLFLVYYVISTSMEKVCKKGDFNPVIGMWFAPIILTPIVIFLTYKASTDSALFRWEAYKKGVKRLFKKNNKS